MKLWNLFMACLWSFVLGSEVIRLATGTASAYVWLFVGLAVVLIPLYAGKVYRAASTRPAVSDLLSEHASLLRSIEPYQADVDRREKPWLAAKSGEFWALETLDWRGERLFKRTDHWVHSGKRHHPLVAESITAGRLVWQPPAAVSLRVESDTEGADS